MVFACSASPSVLAVELNEYKYTSEQLSGGAQALIDRALREKSRLGQTVDVHEEFEYSRGFM